MGGKQELTLDTNSYVIPRKLRRCFSLDDVEEKARQTLPFPIYDFFSGGADDERSLVANRYIFDNYNLIPRYARGVDMYSETIDLSTEVLGQKLDWPFLPSPSGGQTLAHPDGEIGVARAAHATGTAYSLSSYGFTSLEDVASAADDGVKFFQMMPTRSPELGNDIIDRAKAAGYKALIITLDNPTHGNREGDLRSGFSLIPNFSFRSLMSFAAHPRWTLQQLKNKPSAVNYKDYLAQEGNDMFTLDRELTFGPTWDIVADWIARWDGKVAIKGLLSPEDMKLAVSAGASCVIVSNQGGRHFDGSPTSFEMLPDALDAVGDHAEVILDGGIRRGTDVLKAVAMGATACMSARPHYFGLAAGGEAGVRHVFELLKAEVRRGAIFLGADSLDKVTPDSLRRRA